MSESRRLAPGLLLALLIASCAPPATDSAQSSADPLHPDYSSIDETQQRIAAGQVDYATVTRQAFSRIAAFDDDGPLLNAVVQLDPAAIATARQLDEDSGAGRQALLRGVPFLVKANIDVAAPLNTHVGSLALANRVAPDQAFVIDRLIEAGGVLIGTANLSEWANFRANGSVSGWSSVGGQTRNPHVLDRNPCGSSSGSAVAVAAGLVPLAIGTETHGSIVCPAGVNGIVGVKPSLGLVSRDGIVPIAASFDTAGPMTRSVRDAALALQVMAARDRRDAAATDHPRAVDLLTGLHRDALKDKRIGVWRNYIGADQHPRVAAILDRSVALMAGAGATLIDPVGLFVEREIYAAGYQVMLHEFSSGLQSYAQGAFTLAQVVEFNEQHAARVLPYFGQDILQAAWQLPSSEAARQTALAASRDALRERLQTVFERFNLDAVIAPTNGPAWPIDVVLGDRFGVSSSGLGALSGRPAVSLPAGQIQQLPIGVTLVGHRWRDGDLLAIAFALEHLLPEPPRPQFIPSLEAF